MSAPRDARDKASRRSSYCVRCHEVKPRYAYGFDWHRYHDGCTAKSQADCHCGDICRTCVAYEQLVDRSDLSESPFRVYTTEEMDGDE